MNDNRTIALVAGVLALLSVATAVGQFLKRHPDRGLDPAAIRTFNNRLRGWWILCTVLAAAFWLGTTATVVLFGLVSFWALREFITLTPTRKGDHRALFWVFFLFTPLHYVLVGLNRYDVFSVFLPVYATLFVLARVAFAGDYKRFLERTAKIQAGLVVCVYCLSFAPALLQIPIPGAVAHHQRAVVLHAAVALDRAHRHASGEAHHRHHEPGERGLPELEGGGRPPEHRGQQGRAGGAAEEALPGAVGTHGRGHEPLAEHPAPDILHAVGELHEQDQEEE